MKCTRCSAEIPSQSQFCLRCGAAIQATAVNPTGMMPPMSVSARPNNRPMLLTIGLLSLAVLCLGAFVVKGMVQSKNSHQTGSMVQAPAGSPLGAMVQAPTTTPSAPLIQAPTETPPEAAPNPADIIDYLAFLKRVETSKKDLIRGLMSKMSSFKDTLPVKPLQDMMNNDDGNGGGIDVAEKNAKERLTHVEDQTSAITDKFNELGVFLQQRTPPPACIDLRNKYLDHLAKAQGAVMKINEVLLKAHSDPQAALQDAYALKGTEEETRVALRNADEALAAVCQKYRLTKDFDISDPGSSMSGMFGMPGM